jgi:hypothetical protein
MGQVERLVAALSVLLVFVYVVLRAMYVPTFHDEAATFFHYIVTEKYWPYQAHWDANNHILNSALGFYCYKLFGADQIWIRLPNVLSFLVYGFFAVRITQELKSGLLRWLTLIAILTAVFPLEFFSLARGYAMSLAFLLGAIFHGAQYLRTTKLKHQLMLWFWMCLAVAASLTLINSYIILLGLSFLVLFKVEENRWQHVLTWSVFGLSFFAAAAKYGFELKERGLLYTGFDDGFIGVTVQSLVRYQLQVESETIATIITAIGAITSLVVLLKFATKSLQWSAIRLTAFMLLFNAIGSLLLNWIFGMNFPENRVGMYYIPLFLITFAGALDGLSETNKKLKWLGLSLVFFPFHMLYHFNFETTILWPKWHASDDIYNRVVEYQREQGRTLMLSAEYLNELGWAFYNFQNDAELQLLQRDPVPDTLADLIIARPADFDFASIPYDTMYVDDANGVYLLKRKHPIKWSEPKAMELRTNEINGSDEFYELLNDATSRLPGTTGALELSATVSVKGGLWDGQLIITSADTSGNGTYTMIPMHWLRPAWNGHKLHLKQTYHFGKDAVSVKVYFWNINKQELNIHVDNFSFQVPE